MLKIDEKARDEIMMFLRSIPFIDGPARQRAMVVDFLEKLEPVIEPKSKEKKYA